MMWGSTGGLLAGMLGGIPAMVIHLPTRALLWWISGVAAFAARAPAATVGGAAIAILVAAGWSAAVRPRSLGPAAGVLMAAVVVAAVVGSPRIAAGRTPVGEGAIVWHSGSATVVVLENPRDPRRTLEALREGGVREIDLVVASRGNRSDAMVVRSLYDRFGHMSVAAPPMHRVPGAHAVTRGETADLGGLMVEFVSTDPGLSIRVESVVAASFVARAVSGGG